MKALLIDAYDSFVYIIYQYLLSLDLSVDVVRNDQINTKELHNYDILIFGPGPGHPQAANYIEVIQQFAGKLPMLGICLGMQAMVMAFGGKVVQSQNIMHGKTSQVKHNNTGCFTNMPNPLTVTRYHSLIAELESFPHQSLDILARAEDENIMAIQHKELPIQGLQFHPESITTELGLELLRRAILLR